MIPQLKLRNSRFLLLIKLQNPFFLLNFISGAKLRCRRSRKLAESRVRAHVVGQLGNRLQKLVQKALQEQGRLGCPNRGSASGNSNQRQAPGEVNRKTRQLPFFFTSEIRKNTWVFFFCSVIVTT
jgi:hypothetical protein